MPSQKLPISITAISSISALGFSMDDVWHSYEERIKHHLVSKSYRNSATWVAPLTPLAEKEIEKLRLESSKYKSLDNSVLYALYASRRAVQQAGWTQQHNFGINMGSSRGATTLFEQYHTEFLKKNRVPTLTSPTTTLGNISSWVAHDLQTEGPEISHSITCSTALHSVLNGVAWLKSGMVERFLVGGSEAPLTPFTIAQMQALKVYAKTEENGDLAQYPCQAFNLLKTQNTMVLGEGAAVACLEIGTPDYALATIEGVGYATEPLQHNTSISTNAHCFQRSMRMALEDAKANGVDAIVMHAPGTIKGDQSEYNAIIGIFKEKIPALTTNKWKVGHTFGTSGLLSLELAVLMLQHQTFIRVPFIKYHTIPKKINSVLVNAVGFGGNAVSILLKLV